MDMDKKNRFREDNIKAWLLLLKAVDAIKDEIRHMRSIQFNEISPGQLGVLINLTLTASPPTQMELSRLLLVTKGNVTAVLSTLEQKGLIRKRADPRDKRLKRIMLTGNGQSVMKKILSDINKKVASIFGSMGKGNVKLLSAQLVSLLMVFPRGDEYLESINSKVSMIKARRGGFRNA